MLVRRSTVEKGVGPSCMLVRRSTIEKGVGPSSESITTRDPCPLISSRCECQLSLLNPDATPFHDFYPPYSFQPFSTCPSAILVCVGSNLTVSPLIF